MKTMPHPITETPAITETASVITGKYEDAAAVF